MSAPEDQPKAWDEFDLIERLLKPLAEGAPEALGLADDAALIAGRSGFELVVTADAIVEGVHFLPDDPPELVARKLLRVNLSDLAAKGATPYGYFLTAAWPAGYGSAAQERFAAGLALDQQAFGLHLFGGDTVSTPGPLTLSATMLGWVETGCMVRRNGARAGDQLQLSGSVGDGFLGLQAAQGRLAVLSDAHRQFLIGRYRLPVPRLHLRPSIRRAHAAADVSDGLLADAGRVASASGVGMVIDLDRLPLSDAACAWLQTQDDTAASLLALACGGDDYEVVCTAGEPLDGFTVIGGVTEEAGLTVLHQGSPVHASQLGYRHGKDG